MSWGLIFPGQGSQSIGMGHFLYENFKEARIRFEEASDAISFDLKKLCFTGSEEDLKLTENTQPALLLVSTATYDVLREITDIKPIASSGHSVGEYAALVSSGALKFSDAICAVRKRGQAMQEAVPLGEGAMCAVMGMSDNHVREVCTWAENTSGIKPLEPANFNSPGQVVISGHAKAIQWLIENFKNETFKDAPARAKFIPLKVSAPFHCSMMKPAEDKMRIFLTQTVFKNASHPVVQNFTAKPNVDAETLRENLIRQISAPVLWTGCVVKLKELGISKLIEVGAGKVLSGLVKKIDSEAFQTFNLNSLDELKAIESEFNN